VRPERLYLHDIIEAADHISTFVAGRTEQEFLGSEMLRSAVLQKPAVIGEAAARLPEKFKRSHPGIRWTPIVAFRNIAIHACFPVD